MTDTDFWNDPELSVNNDFVTFEKVGDGVSGRVLMVKKHRFDDGSVAPQILLDVNGEEKTVTAGQVRLKAELASLRPGVGDLLTITLTEIEKRSGGKTLKHFDVVVGPQAKAVPTSAPSIHTVNAATQQEDNPLAGFTPEQIAALRGLV